MFVLVYLVDAKQHIIIPQEWILALDQEILNNNGKNSNQNRRVFWSIEAINRQITDEIIPPNFHLPVSTVFPPTQNTSETCYIARIKRFCGIYKMLFCRRNSHLSLVFNLLKLRKKEPNISVID